MFTGNNVDGSYYSMNELQGISPTLTFANTLTSVIFFSQRKQMIPTFVLFLTLHFMDCWVPMPYRCIIRKMIWTLQLVLLALNGSDCHQLDDGLLTPISNPRYINLHAIVCRVASLSGVFWHLDEFEYKPELKEEVFPNQLSARKIYSQKRVHVARLAQW